MAQAHTAPTSKPRLPHPCKPAQQRHLQEGGRGRPWAPTASRGSPSPQAAQVGRGVSLSSRVDPRQREASRRLQPAPRGCWSSPNAWFRAPGAQPGDLDTAAAQWSRSAGEGWARTSAVTATAFQQWSCRQPPARLGLKRAGGGQAAFPTPQTCTSWRPVVAKAPARKPLRAQEARNSRASLCGCCLRSPVLKATELDTSPNAARQFPREGDLPARHPGCPHVSAGVWGRASWGRRGGPADSWPQLPSTAVPAQPVVQRGLETAPAPTPWPRGSGQVDVGAGEHLPGLGLW